MKEHEFTLILTTPEETEEDANKLYESGCSDGSISTSDGVTRIDFHRRSNSLEEAIRSATADVRKAGFDVARVEMDALV